MAYYVYDSSTVSLILRRDPRVRIKVDQIAYPDIILGCPVVYYEVRRGLLAKDAEKQLDRFDSLFRTFIWQDYGPDDWALASRLWAERRSRGRPVADADLLIGVYARLRNAILVTDNEKDFADLDIRIENWTRESP